ncbi:MAG: CAP domain-containing protein [Actinomycetota bacterium]
MEFRIPAGTGSGAWNRFDDPVRVRVGQVLRIHNDDSVAHTAHSDGVPFVHGSAIRPGGFADHPIVAPSTPDPAAPVTYDHDAGAGAPFWVVSTGAGTGGSGGSGDDDAGLAAAEAESLRLVNDLRAGLGLQPVEPVDDEMHAFARGWAVEMRRTGFRHSDARWFENIVWYSDETMTPAEAAAQFHRMWVDSPGHYRNMTNPEWSVIGVGMWHDETGWWGVHVFR